MPIVFLGERSAIASNDLHSRLVVSFRVTNSVQTPLVNRPIEAHVRYKNMLITRIDSVTNNNGEGSIELQGIPANGSYDLLVVSVATQTATTPVVLYNPGMKANIDIKDATISNGEFLINQQDVNTHGLSVRVTLERPALPVDNVFIVIRSFYQNLISSQPNNVFSFNIPPAINGIHILTPGYYNIFYGLDTAQGNIYVANVTTLQVTGGGVTSSLLPLRLITLGGEYINALDNSICINPIIPGFQQPLIEIGDTWRVFYSSVYPDQPNSSFILMREGRVNSNQAVQFITTPNFFPQVNNVRVWLWYSITKPNGTILTSVPITRILDTI